MEIYNVKTREDYDELMVKLEEKGYKWLSGKKTTSKNYWIVYKEKSCINISSKYITFMNIEQSKKQHPNVPIIEYKAKGENMTIYDTETQKDRDELIIELEKLKSSVKSMIENIDECLETLKPEFKVGDYISTTTNRYTGVVERIKEQDGVIVSIVGKLYDRYDGYVRETQLWGSNFRNPTQEEITEYESALTFHNHGRKPFEVKDGDLLENKFGKYIAHKSLFVKENFTVEGNAFLKTVEEVNEWLENK